MTRVFYLALLFLALAGRSALAHPRFALTTVNRYAKLVLTGRTQVHLSYILMIGDVPANALRQAADRDHNGTLDAREEAALAQDLRERVVRGVQLRSSDSSSVLRFDEDPVLSLPQKEVAAVPFSVEFSATFPRPPAAAMEPSELRYQDAVAISPTGEVELRIEAAPEVQIEKTAIDSGPAALQKGFPQLVFLREGNAGSDGAFAGWSQERAVSIRYVTNFPSVATRSPGTRRGIYLAVALVLLFGLGILFGTRRQR